MLSAKRYTQTGEEKGTTKLPEALFGDRVNEHVLWLSVRSHLANARQGTASVKNRANTRGGGRKPYRQKGTGNARAGTRRSPIWVGGARAFGPKPRDYTLKLPRKVRALGVRSALSLAAKEGRVAVVEDVTIDRPRTKTVMELLGKMGAAGEKCLFVVGGTDTRNVFLSGRNIPKLRVTEVSSLNVYELLDCERVILTESALSKLGEASERESAS